MVKEGIAFNEMRALSKLEEQLSVELREGYKNELTCSVLLTIHSSRFKRRFEVRCYKNQSSTPMIKSYLTTKKTQPALMEVCIFCIIQPKSVLLTVKVCKSV